MGYCKWHHAASPPFNRGLHSDGAEAFRKTAERLPKEEQSRRNLGGYASHRCGCCGFRVDWGGL